MSKVPADFVHGTVGKSERKRPSRQLPLFDSKIAFLQFLCMKTTKKNS